MLAARGGDVEKTVHDHVDTHIRYAGAQGMLTGLGGVLAATFTMPANLAGLAIVQARMVAGIAHLRGYDLADPRVRNAILAILMGEDQVAKLVKKKVLPAHPADLAVAAHHDPALDQLISREVAGDMVTRVAGKRLATTVGRRVPVIGGVVGAGTDAYVTWKVGRYVDREFVPRARRSRR